MSRLSFLAVAIALSAVACGSSTTTPTAPTTPVSSTDTFAGPLTQNGAQTFQFTTAASGTITATLTTLAPNSTLVVGLALGTFNGNACQILLTKDSATQSSFIVGQASQSSTYCVRIYDVGNVTDPQTFEIQVNHP
jgi:hypothetical protein